LSVTSPAAAAKSRYDFPVVTYALISLNVVVYLAINAARMQYGDEVYTHYGLTAATPHLRNMFTSSFLHSDLYHLVVNMLFLFIFGRAVERALGVVEYLMLYVGSGIFASVTHLAIVSAFMPDATMQPALGASGSIAGVLGLYAIRFPRNRLRYAGVELHASLLLLTWLILQVFLGILSLYMDNSSLRNVDYWAHMGGFAFGMVVAQLTNMARVGRKEFMLTDAQDSFKRGTLLDVVRKYETLLRYDERDPFTNAELGRTWALLEDAEQAVPYYQTAMDIYLRSGAGDEAYTRYSEMLHLLPNTTVAPDVLYRLGSYLEEAEKPDKAIQILRAVCARPGAVECEMALLKIGQIQLSRLKRPALAVETLAEFLVRYPNSEWRRFAEQTLGAASATGQGASESGEGK